MSDARAIIGGSVSKEFFALVGYAISRWAIIDRSLFDICKFAFNTSNEKTAAVFYRINSITEHLALTDELLRLSVSNRHIKKWDLIVDLIRKLIPFRNDLAHNPVTGVVKLTGYISSRDEPSAALDERPYIAPEQWWELHTESMKLLRKSPKKIIKKEDIILHIGRANYVAKEMYEFRQQLPKRPRKQPPKSPESKVRRASGSAKPRTRAKPRPRPRSSPA